MHKLLFLLTLAYAVFQIGLSTSCKHGAVLDDDMVPMDTTQMGNPNDSTIIGPMDTVTGQPCDPDTVYFQLQVLPLLKSNCAFSGCHDAATAQKGVILESYTSAVQTADVEPFLPGESKIYKLLVDDDEDKRMPPPPAARLAPEQIQLIEKWILQGAKNLSCDPGSNACDTTNVSYSMTVKPILANHCTGCHSGNTPSGDIDLSMHSGVKDVAASGQLLGAISWNINFVNMPQGGDQLPACDIAKIENWINAGAPNN